MRYLLQMLMVNTGSGRPRTGTGTGKEEFAFAIRLCDYVNATWSICSCVIRLGSRRRIILFVLPRNAPSRAHLCSIHPHTAHCDSFARQIWSVAVESVIYLCLSLSPHLPLSIVQAPTNHLSQWEVNKVPGMRRR